MTNDDPNSSGNAAQQTRPLSAKATELLNDRNGNLPVWFRASKSGPEFYTGFSRSKLYELAGKGLIRSVSIREPGAVKGTRLFNMASTLAYIEKCEHDAMKEGAGGG